MTDRDIMGKINGYMAQRGVTCREGLVEKFYLSLKSRPFVFLTGRGQTDLTRLPLLFAEAIGATEDNGRVKLLQVRPDWMDSSDLFGWLDLWGHFIPGVIIDFLKAAQNDPETPYFLILDRLILSRAEYYLRDVLDSVASRGEAQPKPLVTMAYYGRDEAAAAQYGQIPALDNLHIVATVNLDETSLPLNQKLLDRVYTLCLEAGDITEAGSPAQPVSADNCFLQTEYFRLDQCGAYADALQACFAEFADLNRILSKATAYVDFTVRNDAILYLIHNLHSGVLSPEAAMDHMIAQKVLTRVQGSRKVIEPVLEQLLAYCTERSVPYAYSAEKIRRMQALCESDGFASFWS